MVVFVSQNRTGATAANSSPVPQDPGGPLVVSNTITEHNPFDNDLMSELLSDLICLQSLSSVI